LVKIGISSPYLLVCVCVCEHLYMNGFNYDDFISIRCLFQAWREFKKGKGKKLEVQVFERYLEDNLFKLHEKLKNKTYRHGSYCSFYVNDPKRRHIHKANIEDRIIHHLFYNFLCEVFDKNFIFDSYSSRLGKGTHGAVTRLRLFSRKVSCNFTRPCWALKCDVKKFFDNIDHEILLDFLCKRIKDNSILWLLNEIVDSFHSESGINKGIPLGNLTSQIFANIYMNELDQFIKHKLTVKHYLRYADDFILLSDKRIILQSWLVKISEFLKSNLKLELHPNKITFSRLEWGIDFLGYIVLPHHILPRTKTKRRIFNKED